MSDKGFTFIFITFAVFDAAIAVLAALTNVAGGLSHIMAFICGLSAMGALVSWARWFGFMASPERSLRQ